MEAFRSILFAAPLVIFLAQFAHAQGEFAAELRCAEGLGQYGAKSPLLLKPSAERPEKQETVGYMLEGMRAGRLGLYVYRDNDAYFVAFPESAKEKEQDTTYLWAQIPQNANGKATDDFLIVLVGDRIVKWSDAAAVKKFNESHPDIAKKREKLLVPVKGIATIGKDSLDALRSSLASRIDSLPATYSGLSEKPKTAPAKTIMEVLNDCGTIDSPKLKEKVAKAKRLIGEAPTSHGDAASDSAHGSKGLPAN